MASCWDGQEAVSYWQCSSFPDFYTIHIHTQQTHTNSLHNTHVRKSRQKSPNGTHQQDRRGLLGLGICPKSKHEWSNLSVFVVHGLYHTMHRSGGGTVLRLVVGGQPRWDGYTICKRRGSVVPTFVLYEINV